MIGFVADTVQPVERVSPMVAPCGWCRGPVHRADSHVRVRDFCSLACVEKDHERDLESRRGLGRTLNAAVRWILVLLAFCGSAMILRAAGMVGPAVAP